MTIDTDLSTLRSRLPVSKQDSHAALDRVETELARLRDGLRRIAEAEYVGEAINEALALLADTPEDEQ